MASIPSPIRKWIEQFASEGGFEPDVGEVGFPYDINDTQDVPDSHSVVVEGTVNAIDGTLDDRNARVKIE